MRIRTISLGLVVLALSAAAGCSGAGSTSASAGVGGAASKSFDLSDHHGAGPAPAPITVEGMDTPTLGVVLADLKGMTLYRFTKESHGKIACLGTCLKMWKPLLVKRGTALHLPPLIKGKLGRVIRPNGTLQVTFDGWPLYTYRGDRQPSDTLGNGKNGKWFAITHLST